MTVAVTLTSDSFLTGINVMFVEFAKLYSLPP